MMKISMILCLHVGKILTKDSRPMVFFLSLIGLLAQDFSKGSQTNPKIKKLEACHISWVQFSLVKLGLGAIKRTMQIIS